MVEEEDEIVWGSIGMAHMAADPAMAEVVEPPSCLQAIPETSRVLIQSPVNRIDF